MSSPEIIYIQSDNIIEVTGVTNAATGAFLNDATVTLTLLDAALETPIIGQTWPLELSYITASDGNYRGMIINGITVSENQILLAEVIVDAGAGLRRYWQRPCVAQIGD